LRLKNYFKLVWKAVLDKGASPNLPEREELRKGQPPLVSPKGEEKN
jgi:hypothetical protein